MTPSALILRGGPKWPNGDKLRRHGIKRVYYEATDPQISAEFMAELRQYYEVGVMRDPAWNNYNDTPAQFIGRVTLDIKRLAPGKQQLAVMLDIEKHDPAYVLEALTEFQRVQPGKNVVWTLEYHQGGWFTTELVEKVNGYPQLKVVPQLYPGDMAYTVDSHAAARDLNTVGVNDNRVAFFHSLRRPLPAGWDGCLYLENWELLP